MAARSFKGDAAAMGALAKDLGGTGLTAVNREVGEKATRIAERAASADLGGDPKFSGWAPRLDVKVRPLPGGVGVVVSPTRSSAGPWTVAQYGRNQAAGPRLVGPRLTKTGRVSKAKVKRYNGRTAPKGTADDAVAGFQRELLPVIEKGFGILSRKHLGG